VETEHPSVTNVCPKCLKGNGRPRSVACENGQKVIRLVCDICQHEWEDISVDADVLFGERAS
jgi:hypothetical protein